MDEAIQKWRKAELHLHLEGSLEPETLRELAPEVAEEEIRARYRYANFGEFLETYKWVTGFLRGPDDYALAARRLLEKLRAENVAYVELSLSAGVMLFRGLDVALITRALRKECDRSGVAVRFIFDAVRHFGAAKAWPVVELAVELQPLGVVGFGIGGDERRGPAEWFAEVFRYARLHGLRLAPHAGETAGADSVRMALDLGAQRIGHGIRAVHDPKLLRRLRDEQVPLEICLSSNLATGAVRSLKAHPLRLLHDAGVPVVLNTDDPAMFRTTLTREYQIATSAFGFSTEELRRIAENAFRFAFDDAARQAATAQECFP